MAKISKQLKGLVLSTTLLFLVGCAGTRTVSKDTTEKDLANSNFKALAQKYLDDKGEPKYDKESLLDVLEAAKAFNDAGMWKQSFQTFNVASELMIWKSNTKVTPKGVLNTAATTLTNDTFAPYAGKIFQGGMIDYYQAMNALMLGKEADPRPEFNRVVERQDNAVMQLAEFTKSSNESIKELGEEKGAESSQKSLQDIKSKLADGTKDIPTGLTKAKIRNASADFMAAVFRATSDAVDRDEREKSVDSFKSAQTAAATKGGAATVANLGRDIQKGKGKIKNKVIVVYEDGTGPGFTEFRIDLPLFLVSDKVTYTGIALPKFELGKPALGGLKIGTKNEPTVVMTNMNDLAGLEFEAAYNGIVAKAVISTIIKTAAQYAANSAIDKQAGNSVLGSVLKLGTGAAQAALTKADTRSWMNLPNTIQIGYLERPADGALSIIAVDGREVGKIQLQNSPNNLIVVKASGPAGNPAVFQQTLPALDVVPGL